MTVAIAEDAVTPSNAAVSQPFTVNARVVPTITFDSTTGESGGSTGVNIALSESVTGLLLSHLTASDGTLSNVTGSGTAWEADLAFPATGSGTVDIDLAIDSTTPQNAAASASIDYAEPAAALSFGSETIGNQAWVVGTADSITLPEATDGTGTITYSLSSTLPAGMTFTASTRVLSGNPTGRFTSATFTYTATDGNGDTVELTFTIVVTAVAISFASSVANQSWVVGTAVSRTLPAGSGGVGTLTASLSPATPAGVSFTASTRALAGNPTASFTSTTFTYTMTDAEGESESITFTIVVTAGLITLSFGSETISNQAWVAGTAVSVTLPVATGGTGDKTYTLSPTTPAGITFTGTTRVLAGTPTATFTSATFTYTAEDEDGNTVDLTFTIVVTADAIVFASDDCGSVLGCRHGSQRDVTNRKRRCGRFDIQPLADDTCRRNVHSRDTGIGGQPNSRVHISNVYLHSHRRRERNRDTDVYDYCQCGDSRCADDFHRSHLRCRLGV